MAFEWKIELFPCFPSAKVSKSFYFPKNKSQDNIRSAPAILYLIISDIISIMWDIMQRCSLSVQTAAVFSYYILLSLFTGSKIQFNHIVSSSHLSLTLFDTSTGWMISPRLNISNLLATGFMSQQLGHHSKFTSGWNTAPGHLHKHHDSSYTAVTTVPSFGVAPILFFLI